jgi:hypothetical protein
MYHYNLKFTCLYKAILSIVNNIMSEGADECGSGSGKMTEIHAHSDRYATMMKTALMN